MKLQLNGVKCFPHDKYEKYENGGTGGNCKNPRAKILLAISIFAGLSLLVAACNHSGLTSSTQTTANTAQNTKQGTTNITGQTPSEGFVQTALKTVGSCDALLNHFKTEALKVAGAYGLSDKEPPFRIYDSSPAGGEGGEAKIFSTTNVQVAGVDEPDIIKTDGSRIVGINAGELWIVDPTNGNKVAGLQLGTNLDLIEFFLYKDKVLAFYSSSPYVNYISTRLKTDVSAIPASLNGNAHIIEIDISNNTPRIISEVITQGQYVSARRVNNTVNLVLESRKSQALPFTHALNNSEGAKEKARETNRQIIRDTSIENWLPAFHLVEEQNGKISMGKISPCDKVRIPDGNSGLDLLSIITIDLEGSLPKQGTASVIANGGAVYSSGKTLYVAHEVSKDDKNEVWLHKFKTPAGENAQYVASGGTTGTILDQFSMHEAADGNFWIVTTKTVSGKSESFVNSFRQDGERLLNTGQVGNIGKNEKVKTVRFIDNTAYVVTFRDIDPFYVIDLSQPTNPRVIGELKIPGFSSYLHPLGNGKLLGVGSSADNEGQVTGGKLSLFDVSNPANPKEIAVLGLSGFSNVSWEHRAFLYWLPSKRAFIPYGSFDADRGRNNDFFGAIAIDINPDTAKLSEAGKFSHAKLQKCEGKNCEYNQPIEFITRTLVVGDTLWSLSDYLLEARSIDTLEKISSTQVADPSKRIFVDETGSIISK